MKSIAALFVCVLLALSGVAQNPPAPQPSSGAASQAPSAPTARSTQPQEGAPPASGTSVSGTSTSGTSASGTSKDRLFFALPNFLTVENAANIPPLTTRQKLAVVGRSSFDPVQFAWYGFLAGISQAENSEPGFKQGFAGYGKRYGASFADGTIENFMVGAVLPSVLRQDPRYFQSGRGSFFNRVGYSISRTVVTRNDSGRNVFNASEVFGSAAASAISTFSYHPKRTLLGFKNGVPDYAPSDRTLKNAASVWASQIGYDTLTFAVKEFWPDIRRKMKKQKQQR